MYNIRLCKDIKMNDLRKIKCNLHGAVWTSECVGGPCNRAERFFVVFPALLLGMSNSMYIGIYIYESCILLFEEKVYLS